MSMHEAHKIFLDFLGNGISKEAVGFFKQNCMVCFNNQGHLSGVKLPIYYENGNDIFEILWEGEVTEELIRIYGDLRRATDNAACALALQFINKITEYTAFEQSSIGTSIDYYLTRQKEDILIFNRAARLEVSGILEENEGNTVEGRISRKIKRLKDDDDLPTFIIIVEFSKPWSKMVQK